MSILELTIEKDKQRITGLEDSIDTIQKEKLVRETVARMIDESLDGVKPKYFYVGVRFDFTFETVEEARDFTARLLDALGMSKAEKEFDGWGNQSLWKYVINYKNQSIKIEPAFSDEFCQPIPKVSASTYWVCERK